MTRLRLESEAGNLSTSTTYSQLVEHLRLAAEACYTLGHYYKAQDDFSKGQGFLAVGQMLEKVVHTVTTLITKGIRQ